MEAVSLDVEAFTLEPYPYSETLIAFEDTDIPDFWSQDNTFVVENSTSGLCYVTGDEAASYPGCIEYDFH